MRWDEPTPGHTHCAVPWPPICHLTGTQSLSPGSVFGFPISCPGLHYPEKVDRVLILDVIVCMFVQSRKAIASPARFELEYVSRHFGY